MSTEPYGIDPAISQYSTLTPRSAPVVGIGLGSPREFPFKQGQPLDNSIWASDSDIGWTIEPNDGFLRFQATPTSEGITFASAGIIRPFALGLASVTVAFKLRLNDLGPPNSNLIFTFAPSLQLGLSAGAAVYEYWNETENEQERLGPSNIQADGTWHRIVITIQPGVVMIWEDDQHVVTWTPVTPLGATVMASFGVESEPGSKSIDLGDVTVLVGTTQQVRLRMAQPDRSAFDGRLAYLRNLAGFVPDVVTAAKPITDILNGLSIGPGSLFWGLDPPSNAGSTVQRFTNDARVTRLLNAARTAVEIGNGTVIVYVGIAVNLSFIGSVGAGVGLLIGTGPNPFTLLTLAMNGGLITNAGVQAVFDIAVFRAATPSTFLGWGSYVQIGGGEFLQGSLGISGNVPLHINSFNNCGPALSAGVGISIEEGDIGGGLSYTWQMARI